MSSLIAGALAQKGHWRWFFCKPPFWPPSGVDPLTDEADMNIPISGVTLLLAVLFLDVRVPKLSWRQRLRSLDWMFVPIFYIRRPSSLITDYHFSGNALVIVATTCVVLAVTWGGVSHPWTSGAVLSPLVIGIITLVIFVWYEFRFPAFPVVSV